MAALIKIMNIRTINKDRQIGSVFGLIGGNKFSNTWDVNKTFFTDQIETEKIRVQPVFV